MCSHLRHIWTEWRVNSRIAAEGALLQNVYAHITHGVLFPLFQLGVPDFTKLPQPLFPDIIPPGSLSAVLPSTAPQSQKVAVSMPVPSSGTPFDFWHVKFRAVNKKLSETTSQNQLLHQQLIDLQTNSERKIAQLTLQYASTVHSLRTASDTKDTQRAITLTQLAAVLREVRADISNLRDEQSIFLPLLSEPTSVCTNTPPVVLLSTPNILTMLDLMLHRQVCLNQSLPPL